MRLRWSCAWFVLILLASGACLKRVERTPVAPAKRQAQTVSREQLVELINRGYGAVQSIKYSRMEIRAEAFYPERERKENYPAGSGYLVAQRPHWVLMNINNPLTHSTVAAMAADGEVFQLFVPRENKYFTGPVNLPAEGENPFYNIRPQHVVEAIFVRPLAAFPGSAFFVFEDVDPNFSYYVIAEFENASRVPRLLRRLWVERSDLRLVRQQSYGEHGQLTADVRYDVQGVVVGLPVFLALTLTRPGDRYSLHFAFETDAVKVNEPLEESAFSVAKPPGAELVEMKAKTQH
ncbi:MAG: hypothetical protein HYX74_00510 [Acidobacteria bacterium]|nr:hypothetical protein [Acidobacteriota bacterium]